MNSKARMEDPNFRKSGSDKKDNIVKGLPTIYNMNSTARMRAKRQDTTLLDSDVPDIKVPIMEFSKRKRFNMK